MAIVLVLSALTILGVMLALGISHSPKLLVAWPVLLGVGIIGFPLLFETQPRPIAVDIPIEIPRKDNAPPLAMPAPSA